LKNVFHKLRVSHIERQTKNAVAISFEVPETLAETFAYQSGQYLTIKHMIEGEDVRRNYSLCSSPLENAWQVAIKKVTGGAFSTWANESLREGDFLEVMPPLGKFTTPLNPTQTKNYLAFAAGSGITPILSILKTALATEPNSHFTLVYGNQSRTTIMFREAIEALKSNYLDRLSVYHILSREKSDADLNFGRIDGAKCEVLLDKLIQVDRMDEIFLCGPHQMSTEIKALLLQKGVDEQKIHLELFTSGKKVSAKKEISFSQPDEQTKNKVTIILDGVSHQFDLAYESDAILDAGLHEGIELPFACKGGMCCTCKAKLLQGEVDMEVHYGLEPDEIEAGFILTCQSHPKSAEVVVDYDAR
jgi:ring-1,2-phenylacetyl-CoA epoxidase subunit PaaE